MLLILKYILVYLNVVIASKKSSSNDSPLTQGSWERYKKKY